MTLTQFVNNYFNDKVDYDKAFGSQCVDLFRQYTKDVVGYTKHTGPCSTTGGAVDLYKDYNKMPNEQEAYERIKTKSPKPGDVCVFDSTKTNPYGHVAICLGSRKSFIIVLEQDGYRQDGVKVRCWSNSNLLGVLRPKSSIQL